MYNAYDGFVFSAEIFTDVCTEHTRKLYKQIVKIMQSVYFSHFTGCLCFFIILYGLIFLKNTFAEPGAIIQDYGS